MISEQFYYITNREEIFIFNKKNAVFMSFWRFTNACLGLIKKTNY
jgi:hypothetical protein